MRTVKRLPSTAFLLLTGAVLAFLALNYGHVLRNPFAVLLSDGGDGLKNYFTYAWHVAHDPQALTYMGSNHPFGEHVFYTDGHPLLAWALRPLPFGGGVAIGLLNLLLVAGMLAGAWCYHALFRQFGLPSWAAAWGAFGLMALQPQVFRLGGHLSLAHAWPLPLAWLLTMRAVEKDAAWRPAAMATLLAMGTYLVHPYLGLMIGLFQGAYLAVLLVARRSVQGAVKALLPKALVMVLLPLLVFALGFLLGPSHAQRPASPGGVDELATRVLSLLVPTHPPLSTHLSGFFQYEALEWETWCYLGLSTILVLVVLAGVAVKRWAVRDDARPKQLDTADAALLAAFLVLLFAMGVMAEILGSVVPLLRQFRGLGRFAWVFWTVAGVYAMVQAYRHLFPEGRATTRAVLVFCALAAFLSVEGWAQHQHTGKQVGRAPNMFRWDHVPADMQQLIDRARAEDHAGLLPLPFMHVGSEHYQRNTRDGIMGLMLPMAYHARLPIMAGITSRTSLEETRALLALLAPTTHDRRALAARFPEDAHFLIVHSGEPLDAHERSLLERATPLLANARGQLYRIAAAELFAWTAPDLRARFDAAGIAAREPCQGAWLAAPQEGDAPEPCTTVFQAYVADTLHGISGEWTTIAEFAPGVLDPQRTYEIGFLLHAEDPGAVNINLIVDHFNPDGSANEWEQLVGIRGMPVQWPGLTFATLSFRPVHAQKVYKFILNGPAKNRGRFAVHDLYVRPVEVDIWRQRQLHGRTVLLHNNVPLEE